MSFRTLPEIFLDRVKRTPDAEAFRHPHGDGWASLSWRQVGERVRAIANGLQALGLGPEQRVGIISGTRLEWILIDLGILCAGGATTTVYPSTSAEETAYILSDSATVIAFAENDGQVQKLKARRAELPGLKKAIVIDGKGDGDFTISLAELERMGGDDAARFEGAARKVAPDHLATLIYTSGTTGRPKGVELIHDCWVYEAEAIEKIGLIKADDLQYLWLPLAHSFGKVLEAAQLKIGFATAVDGRVDKIVENLGVVKPTFVAAVPRIFEKVHNKVIAGSKESALKPKIFGWAFDVGRRVSALRQQGMEPTGWLATQQKLAHKLVFSKLQNRFGGRVKYFVSGSAPLSRELAEFFHAAGILILEGYGLTETSAASFVNRVDKYKFGTVGVPVDGTEVKIAPEDGEILIKSRGVMRGYHNLPEATAEALAPGGWLRTGDIGEVTPDGFLRITDRKKDLIKTSGGKYVAPQTIEGKLKAICPYVSQVVVHGNNRNFCSALITLDEESIKKWAREEGGLGDLSYAQLAGHPQVAALIQKSIDEMNQGLGKHETIKKFAILPQDLTQEAGDLTPSLKVKRKAVEAKYKDVLDGFYTGAVAVAE
jgi:long-chain acyl-CoA synthetase